MGTRYLALFSVLALLVAGAAATAAQPRDASLGSAGTLPGAVAGVALSADGAVGVAISATSGTVIEGGDEVFVYDLVDGNEGLRVSGTVDDSALAGDGIAMASIARDSGDVVAVATPNSQPNKAFALNVRRGFEQVWDTNFGANEEIHAIALDGSGAAILVWVGDVVRVCPVNSSKECTAAEFVVFDPTDATESPSPAIRAVAWTPDFERLVVGWSESPTANPTRVTLLDGKTAVGSKDHNGRVREIAFNSDANGFVVAEGASVYFYTIANDGKLAEDANGPIRWQQSLGQTVTNVDVAKTGGGHVVLAGGNSGAVQAFEVANWRNADDLEPRRLWSAPANLQGAVTDIEFADDGSHAYVRHGAISAFHSSQFTAGPAPSPLWTLGSSFTTLAVSASGDVLMAGQGQNAKVYRQVHGATVDTPARTGVTPGETARLTATVTNTGSTHERLAVAAAGLPAGWRVDLSPSTFEVLPGNGRTIAVNVTVPAGAAPGTTDLTLNVNRRGTTIASGELELDVDEIENIRIHIPSSPRGVEAGEPETLRVGIENAGNVEADVILRGSGQFDWPMTVDGVDLPYETTVPVGTNTTVEVRVAVRDTASSGLRNPISLRVDDPDGGTHDSGTLVLVVSPDWRRPEIGGVPTTAIRAEPGETAQVTLTVRNVGNTQDTFRITTESRSSDPQKLWAVTIGGARVDDGTVTLDGGSSTDVTLSIQVPRGAVIDETTSVTVTARSTGADEASDATFTVQAGTPEEDGTPLPVVLVPLALAAAVGLRRRRWAR